MLSSRANVIIWDEMLSSGMKCYHLELMLSSWTKCYHLGCNVIILDAMLSFGANVIIWCYHVMLSSGMITHPFFIFPENFTHSFLALSSVQSVPSFPPICLIRSFLPSLLSNLYCRSLLYMSSRLFRLFLSFVHTNPYRLSLSPICTKLLTLSSVQSMHVFISGLLFPCTVYEYVRMKLYQFLLYNLSIKRICHCTNYAL
jgi:hypothetical protein